ncbi:hypothetical protein HQ590_14565 [bacterium]|nr:hypothetical protein [bacterium]
MDLLKKFWDKILLAVVLLALITIAVWLIISVEAALKEMAGVTDLYGSRGETVPPIDTTPITETIKRIENPVQWTNEGDPFDTTERAVETPDTNVVPDVVRVTLDRVEQIPFKLLFTNYAWDPDKEEGSSFQVNFHFRSRTFIVPRVGDYIKDLFENTGYKIIGFERQKKMLPRPGIVGPVPTDVSKLMIQYGEEEPLELTRDRVALERESVASITCDPGWPMPSRRYEVRRGQQFKCGATIYIVVDISARQMIIKDTKSEEQRIIPLGGGAPVAP